MRPLHFALFRNQYVQTDPQLLASTWPEIVDRISQPPAQALDREVWSNNAVIGDGTYCALSPSHFLATDDPSAKRNRFGYSRCNQNVVGKDLLILDIDNDPSKERPALTVEQALSLFADYEFFLYTSYNHRNPAKGDVDKFRIIFPLASYCAKADWELRREGMKALWPFADPASFVLSQYFYVPVVHPDRLSTYHQRHNQGKWLDWEEIAAKVQRTIPTRPSSASPKASLDTPSLSITLKDGTTTTATDLYWSIDEGYEHRVSCYSPFRTDHTPGCFAQRAGPHLFIWDNALQEATPIRVVPRPVREADIDPQIVIDALANIAQRKAAHMTTLHTVIAPKRLPLIEIPVSPVIKLKERYLNDISASALPEKGLVFIKSPKGTGKTELMKHLAKETKGRVLLIGHRISLLSSLAERLNLTNYQEIKGTHDRLAISLDSLTRFSSKANTKELPYDTIFIDESEQVLRHLTADTLKRRRSDVVNILIRQLRTAKRIICLDADLSGKLTIELIAKLRGEEQLETDELIGYLNEYQFTDRSIEMFGSRNHLLTDLLTLLDEGGRAFVATNSRRFAEQLNATIQHYCPTAKTLVVSSHTRDDSLVTAFFDDPTGESAKYDAVIATPSMATGVSIDTKRDNAPKTAWFDEIREIIETAPQSSAAKTEGLPKVKHQFDEVYGFFNQRPLTYHDCDQAISRVRGNVPTKVWIQQPVSESRPPSERWLYEQAKERELQTRIRLPNETAELTQGEMLWLDVYARLSWLEAKWMHNKREQFIHLKEETGYAVTFAAPDEAAEKTGKQALEETEFNHIAKEVLDIMSADSITGDVADQISAKQVKTRQEELQLSRFLIKQHLGNLEFSFQNVYATHAKGHLQKAKRIRQALSTIDDLITDDENERQYSKSAMTDFAHRTKQVEKWRELEAIAGLDYRLLLSDSLSFFRAQKKLDEANKNYPSRSKERTLALATFREETANANITIAKTQLEAIAKHYAEHVHDYNLFFGCHITNPTDDKNLMKAWNATFGYFGLPLRKLKRGPRGNQIAVYEINYTSDGILLEVMAEAFLSPFQE